MTAFAVAVLVVAVVLACGEVGARLRAHGAGASLDDDARAMITLGVELLATLASVVLALLLGSAKGDFDARAMEVRDAAVKLAMLDDDLRVLGGAGAGLREELRAIVASHTDAVWRGDVATATASGSPPAIARIGAFQRDLQAASVATDTQRHAQAHAASLLDDLRRVGFLARVHEGSTVIFPLLALIVFWFGLIAGGLNVFAPRNVGMYALNIACSLSVGGAVYLILEMDRTYGGAFGVSAEPLRAVLAQMER